MVEAGKGFRSRGAAKFTTVSSSFPPFFFFLFYWLSSSVEAGKPL
jgi:hypothetical protein